jgi:hypothetical protein
LSLYKYFGSAVTRLAPSQMKDVLITFCLGDSVPDTELPVPDDATNVNKSLDSRRFNRALGGILAHPGLRLFGHTPTHWQRLVHVLSGRRSAEGAYTCGKA